MADRGVGERDGCLGHAELRPEVERHGLMRRQRRSVRGARPLTEIDEEELPLLLDDPRVARRDPRASEHDVVVGRASDRDLLFAEAGGHRCARVVG